MAISETSIQLDLLYLPKYYYRFGDFREATLPDDESTAFWMIMLPCGEIWNKTLKAINYQLGML